MALNCGIRQKGDVTIVDLTGRLSLGEAVAFGPGSGVVLGETIRELIKKGHKKILLNLAGVSYVDSSGIGQLMGAYTSARNHDVDLRLLRPAAPVLNLLRITQLHTVFDVKDEEESAVAAFSRGAAAQA